MPDASYLRGSLGCPKILAQLLPAAHQMRFVFFGSQNVVYSSQNEICFLAQKMRCSLKNEVCASFFPSLHLIVTLILLNLIFLISTTLLVPLVNLRWVQIVCCLQQICEPGRRRWNISIRYYLETHISEYIFVSIYSLQAPVRLREYANDLLTIPPISVPTMLKNQVSYHVDHFSGDDRSYWSYQREPHKKDKHGEKC